MGESGCGKPRRRRGPKDEEGMSLDEFFGIDKDPFNDTFLQDVPAPEGKPLPSEHS